MQDGDNAIEVVGLTKRYDGFLLDHVSFCVPKGTVMGFIGQNGAGKTTTIKALLNIIRTDGGMVKLFGMDYGAHEAQIKEQLAVVFDELPFHEAFSAEQLSIMLGGIYKNWNAEQYFGYLKRFALPRKKKMKTFSKGMKMKLQIAVALSHGAKLLILDEATAGLDPIVRNEILLLFEEYMQDKNNSILLSSHITSDIEKIADGVTLIDRGKILFSGGKDEFARHYGAVTGQEGTLEEMMLFSVRCGERGKTQ